MFSRFKTETLFTARQGDSGLNTINKSRSLKELMALSWLISGSLALLTCALVFLGFSWMDYHNTKKRFEDDLLSKSELVARRLSGELLLGTSGAVESVSRGLEKELGIKRIELVGKARCDKDICSVLGPNRLIVSKKIPYFEKNQFVELTSEPPPFFTAKRLLLFLICVLPIALVLGIALALQKSFITKYVFGPINSLVETSTGADLPRSHWPIEIRNISERLSSSFQEREQSIYGQMARGVIHDVRTLLHSVLSASSLVAEQADNPEKRKVRLEALYKASEVNLPKINDLINLTLDGSREITVTPKKADVVEILESAIKTNEALGQSKKVKIELQDKASGLVVEHDPIQMERVFTNLIKNAIESCAATEKGREVFISARKDFRAKSLVISVDDAGQGLPLEPQSVFRLLKSTKLHGSGLGLIVSRKIVEAHGGKLVPSHSPLLGGARFEVFLPC